MKLRVGDKVKIIAGKDKGKTGVIKVLYAEKSRVLVEGINIVKKHVKPGTLSKEGGIIKMEKPVHVSNVMYYSAKHTRPFRLGSSIVKGKKYRKLSKINEVIEK